MSEAFSQERASTFQMVNVPFNAPLMGMGGYNVSWHEGDPAQFISNPALTGDTLHLMAGVNYLAFSGAYKMAVTSFHYKAGPGNISAALRHLSFGNIDGYDAAGNPTEVFNASQSAFTVGYQLSQGVFSYGLNMDLITTGISGFKASALTFSIGGLFTHPEKDLSVGATIKHLGFVLNDYTTISDSQLPWDIQLGATYKPEHMPFRFSLTGHHPFNDNLLEDIIDDSKTKEVLAHLVVGTELLISKNISLLFGYNHLNRQELKLQQTAGSSGFSYGFIWRTKNLHLAYGRGAYHVAGASHVLSLNIDINKIFSKI